MRWMSFGSLNSSMSRSLNSGRHPVGATMKLPASVPVVCHPPCRPRDTLHPDSENSRLKEVQAPLECSNQRQGGTSIASYFRLEGAIRRSGRAPIH